MNEDKKEFIKAFEKENNVLIKPYGRWSFWGFQAGTRNACVQLVIKQKLSVIHVGDELIEKAPLNVMKYIFWHELGHLRCRQFLKLERIADSYSLNHSSLTPAEYAIAEKQMETFYRYGIFDIEQLKKIEHLSIFDLLKMQLRLKRLNQCRYR